VQYDILPPIGADVLSDPDWMVSFARTAEEAGFDGIATSEHVVWVAAFDLENFPYGAKPVTQVTTHYADPVELMAFLAAATTRLQLSMATLVLTEHHPVVMAKRLATLDVLSKGRVRAGIGIGWNKEEMEACGENFHNRGKRADEAVEVMRALWSGSTEEGQSYSGKHYSFANVYCNPKPVRGDIPVFMGGSSEPAARRAGRLCDGFQPLDMEGEELARHIAIMNQAAEEAGRDPSGLEVILRRGMTDVTPESMAADEAAGVTRVIVNGSKTKDLGLATDEIRQFGERMQLGSKADRQCGSR
jgi:probable F420-dependent oxidoreductase